jgi:ubiquinone/menaquinone biosynthesis C-methylase UbiE
VLTDLGVAVGRGARARAGGDGLVACRVTAADAAALPFADRTFDRIHHADVLCCLARKRAALRECRRVAKAGARMAFSVIDLARPPRDDGERALLDRSGPSHPDAGADYAELLAAAGWRIDARDDATPEFARCMEVLLAEAAARRDALVALLGAADVAERLARRESTRDAVARGLLRRQLFVALAD